MQNSDTSHEEMSSFAISVLPATESYKQLGDSQTRKIEQYHVAAKTRSSKKRKQLEPSKVYTLRANPAKFVAFQIAGNTKQTCSKLSSFVQ